MMLWNQVDHTLNLIRISYLSFLLDYLSVISWIQMYLFWCFIPLLILFPFVLLHLKVLWCWCFFLQFSSGIDSIASVLLLTNFIKLNPPAFQIFLIHWIKSTASSSPLEFSACHQLQSQILFRYLLRFVSKYICFNLKMKYHQIDVHAFYDLRLDSWYFRSPNTCILVSYFYAQVPLLPLHSLNIYNESSLLLPESCQYTNVLIAQVWSWYHPVVEWCTSTLYIIAKNYKEFSLVLLDEKPYGGVCVMFFLFVIAVCFPCNLFCNHISNKFLAHFIKMLILQKSFLQTVQLFDY